MKFTETMITEENIHQITVSQCSQLAKACQANMESLGKLYSWEDNKTLQTQGKLRNLYQFIADNADILPRTMTLAEIRKRGFFQNLFDAI